MRNIFSIKVTVYYDDFLSMDHFYREKHEAHELQLSLQSVTFSLQFVINPVVGNTVLLIERSLLKSA